MRAAGAFVLVSGVELLASVVLWQIGLAHYNTEEEVERVLGRLKEIARQKA